MSNKMQLEHIIIEGTNVCQAACIFCPREKYTHPLQHMSQELYRKIIDEALEMGVKTVGFASFGEPLCDPGLAERIRYLKDKNKDIGIQITTNLSNLDRELTACIVENVDSIHVSFYGMSAEVYEGIHRGSLKFEESKANVLALIEEKKKRDGKIPEIVMRYLIHKSNEHQVEEFIRFWEPLVDEVMVWKPHNFSYGRGYREIETSENCSCGRPFSNVLYFDVQGRVTTCCFDFNKELEVGNVSRQTIKEVLDGEPLKELRRRHTENDFASTLCQSCDQRFTDPEVLVYSSVKDRAVRQFSMSRKEF